MCVKSRHSGVMLQIIPAARLSVILSVSFSRFSHILGEILRLKYEKSHCTFTRFKREVRENLRSTVKMIQKQRLAVKITVAFNRHSFSFNTYN